MTWSIFLFVLVHGVIPSGKKRNWMVVSSILYFHPYLGRIPVLTSIFQVGWNHQLGSLHCPTIFLHPGIQGGFHFASKGGDVLGSAVLNISTVSTRQFQDSKSKLQTDLTFRNASKPTTRPHRRDREDTNQPPIFGWAVFMVKLAIFRQNLKYNICPGSPTTIISMALWKKGFILSTIPGLD